MEQERIIRGNDPSFRLAATKKRGEFFSSGEKRTRREEKRRPEEGEDYVTPLAGRGRGNRSLQPREEERTKKRGEGGGTGSAG